MAHRSIQRDRYHEKIKLQASTPGEYYKLLQAAPFKSLRRAANILKDVHV